MIVTPGQPAETIESNVVIDAVEPGTRVRYHGSLEDQHGYYTVASQHPVTRRYHLVDGTGLCDEGQTLWNVGGGSITVLS